jgi:hypothetical protein
MRSSVLVAIPLFLAVAPAQAQVSVGVHIDIPVIGHASGGDYHRGPERVVYVNDYPPVPYGQWKKHYRNWHRATLYAVGHRYYDYPVRGGRAVVVYRDHDRYFWGPGDGNWDRADGGYRSGRDDQYSRSDRYDRDDQYARDDRNRRDDQYGRDDRTGGGREDRSRGRGQQRGSASERYALR